MIVPRHSTSLVALLTFLALPALAAEPVVWTGDYVPPPQPVAGPVTLGVFIFPGWYRDTGRGDYPYRTHDEDSEWRLVAKCPKPRPLLGFYDDSLPEVNDWHIKWALEHGISFFAFDWYWNAGEKRLSRTLERGFLQARYNHLMRFCIHWCNHGLDWQGRPKGWLTDEDFSPKNLVAVTEYMAEHYFRRPNYLTVGGRPVLIVWDTRRLIRANGGPAGFRRALGQMNAALKARGLGDLYLVAIGDDPDVPAVGFSATTDYGYYGTDYDSPYEFRGGHSTPYSAVVRRYESMWRARWQSARLPYIVPLGSNWDDRPRARENAAVVTGKTPEQFAAQCARGVGYVDRRVNMAIIEAWNEWGEGSFIEPDPEWGFGFLDAVRRVFTTAPAQHVDHVPTAERILSYSVLQGEELAQAKAMETQPYPDPPVARRRLRWRVDKPLPESKPLRAWEFEGADSEGWAPYQLTSPVVRGGLLSATATGDDPQLIVDNVGVAVEDLAAVALRLRAVPGANSAQLFFSTAAEPAMSADKCFTFGLNPDGRWHTYQITRRPEGKWSGTLKLLRLDVGRTGDRLELDWVRLY